MPDPRNPRIGPSRRHPFAVAPGTDEESRFRPIPDPISQRRSPWLEVSIESREHLTWASEQAKRWGMVWKVVEDGALLQAAMDIALRLSQGPPHAAREIRGCLAASALNDFEQQLRYEAERQGALLESPAYGEGLQAFLDKRPPKFHLKYSFGRLRCRRWALMLGCLRLYRCSWSSLAQ